MIGVTLIAKEQLYNENRMENVSNVAYIQNNAFLLLVINFRNDNSFMVLDYVAYSFVYLMKHRNRVKHLHRFNPLTAE